MRDEKPSKSDNFIIDELHSDDWSRQRAVRLRALQRDPDAFGSTIERERDFEEGRWRARLEGAVATLLARRVEDGADVGMLVLADASAWGEPGDVGVFGVWVAPEVRGCGVGRQLMQAALDIARAHGGRRAVLEVGDHNAGAIALYEAMGFLRTGRVTRMDAPREHITEHERALVL